MSQRRKKPKNILTTISSYPILRTLPGQGKLAESKTSKLLLNIFNSFTPKISLAILLTVCMLYNSHDVILKIWYWINW